MDLSGVNFNGAKLKAAKLSYVNLNGANLIDAELSCEQFVGEGTKCTDLRYAKNLTPEQVKQAKDWQQAIYDQEFREKLGLPPPTPLPSPTNTTNPSQPSQSTSVQSTDDLSSQKGVDYTQLRDLLKAGNWKNADRETYSLMLKVVGGKEGDWIKYEELLNFPCTDLRTIDSLWVKYSNGRFGFSVQKDIYLEVGGKTNGYHDEKVWKKFGDRVGWRVNQDWISGFGLGKIDPVNQDWQSGIHFESQAPVGHLPVTPLYGISPSLGPISIPPPEILARKQWVCDVKCGKTNGQHFKCN